MNSFRLHTHAVAGDAELEGYKRDWVKDGHNGTPGALLHLKSNLRLSAKGLKIFDRNIAWETPKSKAEFHKRVEDAFAL